MITPHTVGTTESRIVSVQKTRTSLIIMNNHATAIIYLRTTKGVAAANGLPVAAGGSFIMKIPEDNPTQDIWCISDTALTDVRVYEGYGVPR